MVRIQGRGVAGTVAAKVRHLFGLCKEFEEKMCKVSAKKQVYMFFCRAAAIFIQKVWKWRRFLTDVGCWRYKMRHLQTKVGHLHTILVGSEIGCNFAAFLSFAPEIVRNGVYNCQIVRILNNFLMILMLI